MTAKPEVPPDKLKKCPFICTGKTDIFKQFYGGYKLFHRCKLFGAIIIEGGSPASLAKRWNMRRDDVK